METAAVSLTHLSSRQTESFKRPGPVCLSPVVAPCLAQSSVHAARTRNASQVRGPTQVPPPPDHPQARRPPGTACIQEPTRPVDTERHTDRAPGSLGGVEKQAPEAPWLLAGNTRATSHASHRHFEPH